MKGPGLTRQNGDYIVSVNRQMKPGKEEHIWNFDHVSTYTTER